MSLRVLFAALALVLPSTTPAAAHTTWLCSLTADAVRLMCVADADPMIETASNATTAVVRGTRFPLDPRGPWVVDLWSPPTDPDQLALLAQATICYRSPGCEVVVAGPARIARLTMPR